MELRKWVRRATVALCLSVLVPMACIEAVYVHTLSKIHGRPRADASALPPLVQGAACSALRPRSSPVDELRRGFTSPLDLQIARAYLMSRHRSYKHLDWTLQTAALQLWCEQNLSQSQAAAAWAYYGWFGDGDLWHSAISLYGKPLEQLAPAEVASLFVPYHAGQTWTLNRRNRLLERMRDDGLITDEDLPVEIAKSTPTPLMCRALAGG